MNSKNREKGINFTLSVVTAICVSAGVLYGFILYKIYDEKGQAEKMLVTLSSELKREQSLQNISSMLKEISAERAKIESYFVDIKGSAGFLEKLQDFGEKAKVSISLDNVDIEDKSALRIDFSANGTFGEVYRLLQILETTPYAIEVRSVNLNKVNISAQGGNKSGNLWSGSFSIRLLSFINK